MIVAVRVMVVVVVFITDSLKYFDLYVSFSSALRSVICQSNAERSSLFSDRSIVVSFFYILSHDLSTLQRIHRRISVSYSIRLRFIAVLPNKSRMTLFVSIKTISLLNKPDSVGRLNEPQPLRLRRIH